MAERTAALMEDLQRRGPITPVNMDPLAYELLDQLQKTPAATSVVLGGGFALKHYVDFRATYDVDAWWRAALAPGERAAAISSLREIMMDMAERHALVFHERPIGETLSLELHRENGTKTFAFQIAERTRSIEQPVTSPYPPIVIETLRDNLASKMNALVSRGAPRDFIDVFALVDRNIVEEKTCWQLWTSKNPGQDANAAAAQVLHHLASIELRRPLEQYPDEKQEVVAQRREFFRTDFQSAARTVAHERSQQSDRER